MAFGFTNMPSPHKHDDRYYTKGEIDTELARKAASNHGTHVSYSVAAPLMDDSTSVGAASHTHKKSKITDFPTSLAPNAHKNTHKTGGTDAITPTNIGAAPASHTHDGRYARLFTILLPKDRRAGDINGDGKVDLADKDLLSNKYYGKNLSNYVPENEEEMLDTTNREHAFFRDVFGIWKTREDLPNTDDGLTYIFYPDFPASGVTEQDTAFLLVSGSTFFQGDIVCLNGKIQVRCMALPPDDLPALVVFLSFSRNAFMSPS